MRRRSITIALVGSLLTVSTGALAPGDEPIVASVASEAEPPAPELLPPPEPLEVDPRNYRMVLAGNIVIGLGGAALIGMIAGLGIRSAAVTTRQALGVAIDRDDAAIARADRCIHTGTILAISGGAGAAALFTTGITLVALGYKRERERRAALSWVPTPMIGPTELGIHWSIQF